jgi:hypothetical protein
MALCCRAWRSKRRLIGGDDLLRETGIVGLQLGHLLADLAPTYSDLSRTSG